MTVSEHVLSFIHKPDPAAFDALALETARYQFENIPAYRRYCQAIGNDPTVARTVADLAFVATVAFKYADLAPDDAASRRGALTFLTSGTTAGRDRRGRHLIADPEIYRASAISHLGMTLFPDARRMRMLAIHPTADTMPESSLATMIGWCIDEFSAESCIAANRREVDLDAAAEFLARAEADRAAVCILGTTAAFAALFAHLGDRMLRLPVGSRMMDTGGPKGQVIPLDAAQVVALAGERLGIAPQWVINEYGMTELCSQMYDETAANSSSSVTPRERVKLAPPWLRPIAIDPATMRPLPEGVPGLLGFFDLANVNSVSAIVTDDLGEVRGARVRLRGRARSSEARGCALALEAFN